MAIGILFLVAIVFVIPGAAVLGAVYANFLMETRPPTGERVRDEARAPVLRSRVAVTEPIA
jgi:hypothetical protein